MQGLPAGWYQDAARAPLEFSAIFAPSWQFVCHVSELPAPGTAARFDCGGRSGVVLRTQSGELRGFRNACRHRGARLVEGDPRTGLAFCVDGRFRCPYHGWTYDDAGALVAVPEAQRFAGFDAASHGLYALEVAEWRGLVFIAFATPQQPLARALDAVAGGWPDLSPLRRLVEPRLTACAADWKLACEHTLDVAHLPIARPVLKPRVFEPGCFDSATGDALHSSAALAVHGAERWSSRLYQQLLHDKQSTSARTEYVYLWPNLLLQLAPDGLSTLQVLPGPTGHCTLRETRHAAPDSSREMKLLRYTHDRVRRQARNADVRLLERVQQGFANLDADATWTVADNEPGVRWFVTRCRDRTPPLVTGQNAAGASGRNSRRARRPVGA